MFDAAVTLTGLQPLVNAVEQRIAAGAAIEPDVPAPSPLLHRDLFTTHQQIKELDRKISATRKQYGDDAVDRSDYLAFEDERYEALNRLSSTAAGSWQDLAAKAATLKIPDVLDDSPRCMALAESLASDVLQFSDRI
jgi:hypothetical protein